MNRKIQNLLAAGLIVILIPTTIKAQIFDNNELYPKVIAIKGKYYNGSGGRGFWSLDYIDSLGRVREKESYCKSQLMSRQKIEYDFQYNKIFYINTFDYNNPERIDTFKYKYEYAGNRIVYEYRKLSDYDSTVTALVKNLGDSVIIYQTKKYIYRPNTGKTFTSEIEYTYRYNGKLLISCEILNKNDNTKEINLYEYYDNGRLKRRVIERIPKSEQESIYIGGPGSDDEYYKYKLDSKGRVKKFYRIIKNKKYKIATYKYIE